MPGGLTNKDCFHTLTRVAGKAMDLRVWKRFSWTEPLRGGGVERAEGEREAYGYLKRLAKKFTAIVLALTVLALVQPRAAEAGLPKVTIVHKGKTITVGMAALLAHLANGDTFVGECPPNCGG